MTERNASMAQCYPVTEHDLADKLESYANKYSGDWTSACPTISWDHLDLVVKALRAYRVPDPAPTDTSDAQFETMRRALEDMANLPPALLPSQLVDRFIEVRVKARAALPIPAPLRLPVEDLKVYRDPTRAQATAPPKCSCGKPDNVSCYNPDCARPA